MRAKHKLACWDIKYSLRKNCPCNCHIMRVRREKKRIVDNKTKSKVRGCIIYHDEKVFERLHSCSNWIESWRPQWMEDNKGEVDVSTRNQWRGYSVLITYCTWRHHIGKHFCCCFFSASCTILKGNSTDFTHQSLGEGLGRTTARMKKLYKVCSRRSGVWKTASSDVPLVSFLF